MKLSIIVPVYNMVADGKLTYCMDSLVHQQLSDYEIIAVDDCSTDESFEVLSSYEKRYPDKVVAIKTPENLRQGGARNLGIERASGEWIGFIDSDDWIAEDMYARLLAKAESTGADVVSCQYNLTHNHSMDVGKVIEVHSFDQTGVLDEEKQKKLVINPGSMVVKIYKKAVVDEYKLRFPEKTFYEDNCAGPLWMLRFKHFELVDEPLYYYYQHEASTVHVVTVERCHNRMDTAKLLVEEMKRQGFYDKFYLELEMKFIEVFYVNTLFSYMASARFPKLSFLREIRDEMRTYFPDFMENKYYLETYDAEQKKMVNLHMNHTLFYVVYDKLLRLYRRVRYGKNK